MNYKELNSELLEKMDALISEHGGRDTLDAFAQTLMDKEPDGDSVVYRRVLDPIQISILPEWDKQEKRDAIPLPTSKA